MELIIATSNTHKFRELRGLLKHLQFDLFSLRDFPDYQAPAETGNSFEENALLKASHASFHLKKWCVADDSGLVVPALKGAPGILSSLYAGPQASDRENRLKLLIDMKGFEDEKRAAYFECCLVLASPAGETYIFKGICEGMIQQKERGRNGFGYDPLFQKYGYNQTFGELDESVKNSVSHRAKAFQKLQITLEKLQNRS